jgi:hypothetical protein
MKSPLAVMTFSSLDRKQLQALLVASLGMLLKTSMMVVIRDCFFVRGSVNTSLRYATLYIVKWINIMRARRPDLCPLRQVFVEDVENCFNEGKFNIKKLNFSPKWVSRSLCSLYCSSHFPCFLNFYSPSSLIRRRYF